MARVLRYGVRTNFEVISFLIVSSAEFCRKISEGLLKSATAADRRILVHQCESVIEVIATCKNLHVDFIVLALDSRLKLSLDEVENNICLVDQNFVLYGQICLVHGNHIPTNAMGVTRDKILEICAKYNLRLLNANIFVSEDCFYLSERMLKLVDTVLGHGNGFPLLPMPSLYQEKHNADDSVE